MKNTLIGKKVLITCTNWFVAPNEIEYKAIWGTLHDICEAKEVFGFSPGRTHANWFIRIGDAIITGCQVNYLVECPDKPQGKNVERREVHEGKLYPSSMPSYIYISE